MAKIKTSDIEDTNTDRAIATIKAFQAGNTTQAAVKASLVGLSPEDLKWISLGTRLPLRTLLDLAA